MNRSYTLFLLALSFIIVGCAMQPEVVTKEVEVTRVVTEVVVEEGSEVEVTRVIEEVVEVIVTPAGGIMTESEEADTDDSYDSAAPPDNRVDEIVIQPTAQPLPQAVAPEQFFADYGVNPYIMTSEDNLSTFSLDVDTASYSIARNYLESGALPPADAIRVEEFVNSFDPGYQNPPDVGFAVYADGAPSPFHNDGTYFLRVGVQGYDVEVEERPSAALTFVVDTSGSMSGYRLNLVKESLEMVVNQMRPDDKIAVVEYGSQARVVLYPTEGNQRAEIMSAIYGLNDGGSTNLEGGLLLGYDLANQMYMPGGINRVILASDGVANVGDTGPNSLVAKIRGYADAGITLTTLGVGMNDYNDVMLETLADDGDGNYAYIDTLDEAREVLEEDIMGTLLVIGLDAKIQVEFDRNVVQQYRLIGYENRAIADHDFRNDTVDAAEFGAGHSAVAIYAIQMVPGANGRVANVNLRWQDPNSRVVTEISGSIMTEDLATTFDEAPLHHQLAVVVSQFAEYLRNSYWATDVVTLEAIQVRADRLAGQLGTEEAIEFAELVNAIR